MIVKELEDKVELLSLQFNNKITAVDENVTVLECVWEWYEIAGLPKPSCQGVWLHLTVGLW